MRSRYLKHNFLVGYMDYRNMVEDYLTKKIADKPKIDPNTINKLRTRIYESIEVFEQNNITFPLQANYENILRPYVASKKGKRGNFKTKTIKEWLSAINSFYTWTKENETMREHEDKQLTIEATEHAKPGISTVEVATQAPKAPQISNENTEATPLPVNIDTLAKKSAGRPRTTGRTEKFTLYMTADIMENLNIVAGYDNITLTDLLNNIVENYINTREDDINWVKDIDKQKELRKLRQTQQEDSHHD